MVRNYFFLLSTLILIGCGEQPMYDEFVEIPETGWHKDSMVSFSVPIKNKEARYYVEVSLRNNAAYENRNIWFFRSVTSSQGIEYTDTAQYYLANEYGEWSGKGLGELKTNDFPFNSRQALQFADTGMYTFNFTQAMRTDKLTGIEDIGLRVYKTNSTQTSTDGAKN